MSRGRILILDDEEIVRHVLRDLLRERGYVVETAIRGDEALAIIQKGEVDLLLVDLILPGIRGFEVMEEVRARRSRIEIIVITGHASLDSAIHALRLGARDYLLKPFEDLDLVLRVIDRVFESRHLMHENEELTRNLIRKNRQLESAVHRLSSINDMGRALHSILDLDELLNFFVRLISSQLGAERTSLMLLDEETGELTIRVAEGIEEEIIRKTRVRLGEGISGWVAKVGTPLLVENIDQDSRIHKSFDRSYRTNSFISAPVALSIPLRAKDRILGVINLNNRLGGEPFSPQDMDFVATIAGQLAIALENARLFDHLKLSSHDLKEANFDSIKALAEALESKDVYTRGHSDRTVEHAERLSRALGLPEDEVERIKLAAILHDIGKIGIPDQILNKPAKLSDEEYQLMKTHPVKGTEIIKHVKFLAPVVPMVRHDHERWDGKGYPDGLQGEAIPQGARIVALVDAFDAMTTDRIYRKAPGKDYAVSELKKYAGTQFDPDLVHLFLSILKED